MKAMKLIAAATAVTVMAATFAGVPSAEAALPNSEMVAAMQRDLGLTHGQVLVRFASEDAATKVSAALEKALGERISGTSFDAATGKSRVAVTDPALVDRIRAAGAEAHVVRFSARQLDSIVQTFNAREKAAPKAVTGWGIDTVNNRITLRVLTGQRSAADAFVRQAGVDTAAVAVAETPAAPKPYYDVLGGDAYYIGSSARCSVGFAVNGGFLTAGHCAALTGGGALFGYNQVAMGSFSTYRFPGDDYAYVQVNSDWTPVGRLNTGQRVGPPSDLPVGTSVCKSGSTTGWTCGTIQAKNQTVRYPEGTVTGLVLTDVRSDHGDSGGPYISRTMPQGLLSGGDTVNSYYYPVNAALAATGTQLVH